MTEVDVDRSVRERFQRLDPAEFPNLASLLGALFTGDGDERFSFGLRLMIDGLARG